ncbi:MAG TPA: TatD family hydrolase [Desulfotignum sp.]|nr:TatD family hydrolase [Desulfotignum sp.]
MTSEPSEQPSEQNLQYVDAHCHLHDPRIVKDVPGIVQRALDAGVTCMVTCATMEKNFGATTTLSGQYPAIVPCYGIHPWFLDTLSDNWLQRLGEQVAATAGGVGETGLDFMDKTADRDRQIAVFAGHLSLAKDLERPINIHIRKAWDAFIRLLKKTGPLKPPGLVHSFSGSADLAVLLERYNLYISFSGSLTRPGAKKVVSALKAVSQDRYLLETDTPDIYPSVPDPEPHGRNEPKNLPAIAQIAAARAGVPEPDFVCRAYANARQVFAPLIPAVPHRLRH